MKLKLEKMLLRKKMSAYSRCGSFMSNKKLLNLFIHRGKKMTENNIRCNGENRYDDGLC